MKWGKALVRSVGVVMAGGYVQLSRLSRFFPILFYSNLAFFK